MKRVVPALVVVTLMVAALAFSGGAKKQDEFLIDVDKRNPWTHLRFNNAPEAFHFVVVSDRTGGHRARVFSQAVEQINLLQPSFVISVGDLIEGYSKDKAVLEQQWKELQSFVCKLQMPFFYVPGNHDVSNSAEVGEWKERFGRSYYHFLYRDVLFLALANDDEGEDKAKGNISMEQVEYFQKVLQDNKNVRWTIVCLHKPVWSMPDFDKNNFQLMEKALAGRNYTVFAGHVHRYRKFVRQGMNYYQLATTGGGSKMRGPEYGEFDHIAWVTMTKEGPVIANLMLDGIWPDNLRPPVSAEEGIVTFDRKAPQPAKGKLFLGGEPMAGAWITLYRHDAAKKAVKVSDGLAAADGSFVLSSYVPNDGTPVGEYDVTVEWRMPWIDDAGNPGKNRGPEKYASIKTTDLKVNIKPGPNDLVLDLAK